MSIEKPIFWDYLIFDENGIVGIQDNTPGEIEEAYADYLHQEEENQRQGIKI